MLNEPLTPTLSLKGRGRILHPVARRIVGLMLEKQSNLTLSADVYSMGELLSLADKLGSSIVVLKTHMDCIDDFCFSKIVELRKLAQKHRFLIFEDRKFADIGHTVQHQFQGGVHRIADWADLINAHGLPGGSQIDALKACVDPTEKALLLLANMSPAGTLFSPAYSQQVIELALQHTDYVCGFIAPNLRVPSQFLNFAPGVHLNASGDSMGQRYQTPENMREFEVDSVIVGRGILQASDPVEAAEQYRKIAWNTRSN